MTLVGESSVKNSTKNFQKNKVIGKSPVQCILAHFDPYSEWGSFSDIPLVEKRAGLRSFGWGN